MGYPTTGPSHLFHWKFRSMLTPICGLSFCFSRLLLAYVFQKNIRCRIVEVLKKLWVVLRWGIGLFLIAFALVLSFDTESSDSLFVSFYLFLFGLIFIPPVYEAVRYKPQSGLKENYLIDRIIGRQRYERILLGCLNTYIKIIIWGAIILSILLLV